MILQPVFSDFVFVQEIDVNNEELKKVCLDKQQKDEGRVLSNVGGWQSNDLSSLDGEFNLLFEKIHLSLYEVLGLVGIRKNLVLLNAWINVNKHKDYNSLHYHPRSVVSGVYYIHVPEDSNSNIIFNDGSPKKTSQIDHLKIEIEKYNEFTSSTWEFKSREGRLLLFPSWLDHLVEPNQSQEPRISISFNFGYQK